MDIDMKNKYQLLLCEFKKLSTVNEAMGRIWVREVKSNATLARGPRFYTHLNKLPTMLQKYELIEQVGECVGPTNRVEKIWKITENGKNFLKNN